jgi:hypothetical protein
MVKRGKGDRGVARTRASAPPASRSSRYFDNSTTFVSRTAQTSFTSSFHGGSC